ncbi:MAG: glucose 1-dehydrogenase [Anaerolineae bacterium]|nr:glucose 1-dehydrogenase [Anaerolineae bacterium]
MQKSIIVTGGGSGIGKSVCEALASEGYAVLAADLRAEAAEQTAQAILAQGRQAAACAVDIASQNGCGEMVQAAVQAFGRVDGLVNCAGISKPVDSLACSADDWQRMIDIQLNGAFYVAQAVGRQLVTQGEGGALVFISSTNAEAAFPRRASYCAAKAGVAMLTKVLAIEWAQHQIRVNAVGPAYVETDMTLRNIAAGNVSREAIEKRIPLGRLCKPGDVADAVSFLLSDKSSFITGQSLYVDGGWLAYGYF